MLNNSEINNLLNGLSERLNTTPEQLKANLEKGNLDSVVSKMSSGQAKRLQKILDNHILPLDTLTNTSSKENLQCTGVEVLMLRSCNYFYIHINQCL